MILPIQLLLRLLFQQVLAEAGRGALEILLLQNVADALETGRQRLEIGRLPQALNAREACRQIGQVAPSRRHGRVHFVVLESAGVLEIEFHALLEERRQLRIAFQKIEQRKRHPAFHQDLHHALRGAP